MTSDWGIYGHEQAVRGLRQALTGGRLVQSYLFLGPARVGKSALARAFAQALLCEGAEPPCGECQSCRLMRREAPAHPDFHLVGLEKDRRFVGIDRLRELDELGIHRLAMLKPLRGRRRVFMLEDADLLSREAANSVLKLLEEPAPHAVLLLVATDATMVLPTIISRCQVLNLRPLAADQVGRALVERWQADPEAAHRAARLSGGRLGWAVEAVTHPGALDERAERLAELVALHAGTRRARFAWAERTAARFSKDRPAVSALLDLWAGWWRDVALEHLGRCEMQTNADCADELKNEAGHYSARDALSFVERVRRAGEDLEANVNPRLALEGLTLDLPPRRVDAGSSTRGGRIADR